MTAFLCILCIYGTKVGRYNWHVQQFRIGQSEVPMTRFRNHSAVLVGTALLALTLAACAPTGSGMTSAEPAKSAENQKKQADLQGMEAVGQRNSDQPFK